MKGIFVAGTDTEVGKTMVTGLLARFLSEQGYRVITQKWVQTGSEKFSSDLKVHLKLMKKRKKDMEGYLSYMSPYVFKTPVSPHLAAELEKTSISAEKIKNSYKFLARKFERVIVEGTGGCLVPLSRKKLLIDIVKELDLGVVIVSTNKLGAINRTLLTLEALKRRNIKIIGVVFNNQIKIGNNIILKDNPKIINEFSKRDVVLGVLPYLKDENLLYHRFIPMGRKITRF